MVSRFVLTSEHSWLSFNPKLYKLPFNIICVFYFQLSPFGWWSSLLERRQFIGQLFWISFYILYFAVKKKPNLHFMVNSTSSHHVLLGHWPIFHSYSIVQWIIWYHYIDMSVLLENYKYTTRKIHKNYIQDLSGLFSIISHVSLSMT